MENKFSKDYNLTVLDFDCFGNIKPSAILNYCQGIAGEHAESLQIGRDELMKKNLFWVLSKVKFILFKDITSTDKITVTTWPLFSKKITYDRDLIITNDKNEKVAGITTKWCIVDFTTRKLSKEPIIYPLDELLTARAIPDSIERISDVNFDDTSYDIMTKFNDLDMNFHVNNARYPDFVLNCFDLDYLSNKKILSFQIDYIQESKSNTLLQFFKKEIEPNKFFIIAKDIENNIKIKSIIAFLQK